MNGKVGLSVLSSHAPVGMRAAGRLCSQSPVSVMEVRTLQLLGEPKGRAAGATLGPVEQRDCSSELLVAWYSGHVLFPSLLFLYTICKKKKIDFTNSLWCVPFLWATTCGSRTECIMYSAASMKKKVANK